MKYLNATDYTVIAIYFSVLVGLGFYLQKKASASLEDYFLGGRQLPWWALGISGMASFLDITGTMIIVSFLYMLGPRGLFIEFRGGAVLVLVFMLLWTGKWHRRSQCMTGAEWMIYRFGRGLGGQFARIVMSVAIIAFTIGMLAYMIKGVGLFLSMFLPLSPFYCALILILVATCYTMASGFYGVVFTDIFQSAIILIAVVTISTMAFTRIADSETIATLAEKVTHNRDWMSAAPHWRTSMPEGEEYQAYQYLAVFALFYLLKNVIDGAGTGDDPKYFGARSDRECGLLTFLWTWLMMFRWPMMMGFAVLGVLLINDLFPDQAVLAEAEQLIKESPEFVARYGRDIPKSRWEDALSGIMNSPEAYPELVPRLQALFGDRWTDKLKLLGYEGAVNPERILPAVLLFDIPAGFRGLLLVALIAASMSTFDSNVNKAIGFFTRDIYQAYLRPGAQRRELIGMSYAFGTAMVACGFALSYSTDSINDIWGWVSMALAAGLIIPRFLKFYWWRFNGAGLAIGMGAGLICAIVQRALWPGMDERWTFTSIASIALAATIIGTFLTPPADRKVLENFYRTTRPFGFWGPFKGLLSPQERKATAREHLYEIISIPFALGWHVTLFILPMLIVIHSFGRSFWLTLAIFILGLAGMYVFWYRNLPSAREGPPSATEIAEGSI